MVRSRGRRGASEIVIQANDQMHAVLWAGEPLHVPVAARGPFVMNNEDQLSQAYADYRAGRF